MNERAGRAGDSARAADEPGPAAVNQVAAESSEADRDNADLDARHAEAVTAHDAAAAQVRQLSDAERRAEKEAATWQAREDALAMGLRRGDGAGALLARADQVPGLLGSLAGLLTVAPGHEAALAAALGGLADAVAVTGIDEAAEAMRLFGDSDIAIFALAAHFMDGVTLLYDGQLDEAQAALEGTDEDVTLAERLRSDGFLTAAFVDGGRAAVDLCWFRGGWWRWRCSRALPPA